jgi:4-hydroxy-2-oxoglutarate aldolase
MDTKSNTPPPFGVYTPLVTFFHEDESLDLKTTSKHALRMAEGKVAGLVLQGSNGEAPHLLHEERQTLVRSVKETLKHNGYGSLKLIVGCGSASVRETLLYLSEAKDSGADYGLVLPPAYWTAGMSVPVIEKFFKDVCSPVSDHLPISRN